MLDAACGEGYGSALLCQKATKVVGLDVSAEAISHASSRYSEYENLEFVEGNCTALEFEDDAFDCIVSFETLEHLGEQSEMLGEFRRVLKPDGVLIISSPDKKNYSDVSGFDNPYHVKELYREELEKLLAQEFPAVKLLGQKLVFQSAIWEMNSSQQSQDSDYGFPG